MLVFVDESGDVWLKLGQGSSEFFVVTLVVFEDNDEAEALDQRVDLLMKELGINLRGEFKFNKANQNIRKAFLQTILPYTFFYFAIVINKKELFGEEMMLFVKEDKVRCKCLSRYYKISLDLCSNFA